VVDDEASVGSPIWLKMPVASGRASIAMDGSGTFSTGDEDVA
jgi:hypothetical protein